jgi:hypothetical protein
MLTLACCLIWFLVFSFILFYALTFFPPPSGAVFAVWPRVARLLGNQPRVGQTSGACVRSFPFSFCFFFPFLFENFFLLADYFVVVL